MNKKIFTGLILLMGISIIGIIAVQVIWINNALRVKKELFSRGVSEALNNSVNKLEHFHDFTVFNRMVLDDSIIRIGKGRIPPPPPIPSIKKFNLSPKPGTPIKTIASVNGNTRIQVFTGTDNQKSNVYEYRFKTTPERHSSGSNRSEVVVFHNDSMVGNLDSMYKYGIVKIDSVITHLDTAIAYPTFRKKVEMKAGRLKRMANQVVAEISEWDIRKVDKALVEKVLKEEFENTGIPIHFEYGIFRDSILTDRSPDSDSIQLSESAFQVGLYPNDIFQKNLRLSVYFPGRESFILRSLNWLMAASFIFSLIILATFSLSIFFILRQKKISEMKSDFINNMTHEFKTPIATISVAADSITNEKVLADHDQVKFFAGMIKKENTRMNRQVEDILTIARLDRKDFEFKWEPNNVHELVEDAVQSIILQVEKRGGKIETHLTASNPVVITDKNHFSNLMYNLLDNANKYSADAPDITITTKNSARGVIISVEDKGIGMTKSVQTRIFERFYRQSSGNIHNVKGFGLGLSYAKAVVEANKGTISVHSEPGKGSSFEVYLPFLRE